MTVSVHCPSPASCDSMVMQALPQEPDEDKPMTDTVEFTPEERAALRRMLQADERERYRKAQAEAARLTKELRARYGNLAR